jgi:hypothetical protein
MQTTANHPGTTTTDRTSRARRLRHAAVGGLVLVGTLAGSTVVSAAQNEAAPTPATAENDIRPRLERACLRIPNLTIRTNNLIERITGDAETRGSLLWLQAQIDRAETQGREQLVTVLENRLEVRTATVPVLEQRLEGLAKLSTRCAELGVGV